MSRQEAGRGSVFSDEEQAKGFFHLWRVFAGVAFSFGAFFLVIQVTACIVILVLSKHEHPKVPLRAFITGHLCACALFMILLFLDFLSQKKFLTLLSDNIMSDSATVDRSLLSFGVFQAISIFIKVALSCFISAWLIAGCIWVSMASSTSSDTPILFWGSLGFIILAASGFAVVIISSVAACCCIPIILSIKACFS